MRRQLDLYMEKYETDYHVHSAVVSAIERYMQWVDVNPDAVVKAREGMVVKLHRLYGLGRFGEAARYYLYRHTYFADAGEEVADVFGRLLHYLHKHPDISAVSVPELSDLQATLKQSDDRHVFGRLVFPRARAVGGFEVLAVGETEQKHVVVKSQIESNDGTTFFVREATEPSEIGQLYRLFLGQRFPKTISESDQFLVVLDSVDRIVGGACYEVQSQQVVYLDGIVITRQLQNQGLGSALLEDFCVRMSSRDFDVVRTHFYRRHFYLRRSFQTDGRWGGLVRYLNDPA